MQKGKFSRKTVGKMLLAAAMAAALAGGCYEVSLNHAQRDFKTMLETEAGSYRENVIVLSNTTKEKARRLADELGGTLRTTKNGVFATIRLPEEMTLSDLAQEDEYRKYLRSISLDRESFMFAELENTPNEPEGDTGTDESAGDESAAGDTGTGEPTGGESVAGDTGTDEPTGGESVAGDTGTDEPTGDESAMGDTGTDEPAGDESAAGDTGTDEPAGDESAAGDTGTDEPAGDESAAGDTGTDEPAGDGAAEESIVPDGTVQDGTGEGEYDAALSDTGDEETGEEGGEQVDEEEEAAEAGTIRANYEVTDPFYSMQSYLDYINIGDTWTVTRGEYPTGGKVKVAIIDSGIDVYHPEFFDKNGKSIISKKSYNATEDKVVDQYDISVIEDESGHGTAVAGVIAAQMNNDIGITGIAPDVELLVIKCGTNEDGAVNASDLVYALYYAIEQDVQVINFSLYSEETIPEMGAALQLAVDSDIITVAAAGNGGRESVSYPASSSNTIAVGALGEKSWELDITSNYGVGLDLVAPGAVVTTSIAVEQGENGTVSGGADFQAVDEETGEEEDLVPAEKGYYSGLSGTSAAAPVVTSAVALYVAQHKYVMFDTLKADLLASCKDLGDPGVDNVYAYGALDLNAFVCEEKGLITYDYCTEEIATTTQVFVRRHTIQTVPEPEREKLIFDDWYYDKAYTRVFDYDAYYTTQFVDDVTLYAKWVNEDDEDASVYQYRTLEDGTVEIVSYKGKRRYLTIPDTLDGKIVSSIGVSAFGGNNRLRSVTMPSGLVHIKANAFVANGRLRTVIFTGDKLEDIGKKAFSGCASLRALTLPDSVMIIGEEAFSGCRNLTELNVSENSAMISFGSKSFAGTGLSEFYLPKGVAASGFSGYVLSSCSNMRVVDIHPENSNFTLAGRAVLNTAGSCLIYYPAALTGGYAIPDSVQAIETAAFSGSSISEIDLGQVEYIGDNAFESTSRLTELTMPDTVVFMGEKAFQYSRIRQIALSENLQQIASRAFYGASLREIHIPAAVAEIGEEAFRNANYLKRVTVADNASLGRISGGAFKNCSSLVYAELPESLTEISPEAFYECRALAEITLPSGLDIIGASAFYRCYALTELNIPASVSIIGNDAFCACTKLETVTFEQDGVLKTIPHGCFESCYRLKSISFADATTRLGTYAFSGCTDLEELDFGENSRLDSVGEYCFEHCTSLKTMQLPDTVTTIGKWSYTYSGLNCVELSANVTSIGDGAFGACYDLTELTVDSGNPVYASLDNVLFDKNIQTVFCVPASFEGSYALPETVTTTAPYSFFSDKKLTGVALPEGLTDIQHNSFQLCSSLAGLDIPDSVSNIGREAFMSCHGLEEVTFGESSSLRRLGIYTFSGSGIRQITIPASVESMAQYVFQNCSRLKTVTFAENSALPYVAAYVFKGTSVENVVFEKGSALTSLQAHAFDGATRLKSVDFGDALVTNVDNYAFYGCRMLEQVTLPETVTYVGRYAFYNCAKLERIDIPADVEFIGMYAFSGTNNIKVFFRSFELPYYIQENWDAGIAGYFLGAKDYVVGEEWEYAITHNDTAALAVYKGSESELTLDEVDGYPVEKIGARCFYENDALTSVILCDTVNEIGNYAFMGCGSLERIDVPNAVVKIGDYAFAGSDTQVCFGEGSRLESIGKYAFSSNGTESMELADSVTSIGEGAFYRSAIKELTIGTESDLKTIGRMAFAESGLTGIYLPAGLSEVGAEAFRDTADLADITIAGGVQELKLSNSAFERAGMREITVPARVWYIGEYTFASCPNLQNIHVAAGNEAYTSVDGVLCDIYGTTLVQFPSGRTGAYEVPAQINVLTYASFKNSAIEEVTFAQGSGVKTIGWQTFSGVQELKRIELPDSLVSIDFYAFENCTALTDVVIQNNENFSGIYEGAFYNCTALKNITLPDSLTEISEYAFYGCSALEALPMSQDSKVQGIYDYAFYGCSGITEIPEFEDLTELGEYAFANTGVTEYTVSATLSGIAETAFSGAPLENIFCDETNEEYVSIEGVLFERGAVSIADTEALVVWPEAKLFVLGEGLKEITTSDTEPFRVVPVIRIAIADTVETIEGEAFRGFFNMVEIQLSDSVTDIGGSAFYNCSGLTELTIPDGVTDIGGYAFYGLSNVKVFTIGKGVERVGKLAFSNMDRLEEVHFNAVAMEDVTDSHILFNSAGRYSGGIRVNIGADVLRVPAYLFYRTTPNGGYIYNEANQVPKITSVSFAEDSACVEIGDYAFYNGKLLKQFIIPDSVITVGERAFSNCTALTDLTIGAGVQSIGKYAFSACTALEAAAFPDALETLGTGAFHNCAALADVELNENLTEIGGYAFYCCKALEQVSFPDSLESVGEHAFRGCTSMKRVDYNDGLTKIGDFAFGECTALTEVVLPDSVESVGAYTYRYCTGLERAVLGNGLSQIPSYIFYGCTVLREITVGEGVTTMEEKALAGINGLEILYFNAEEAEDLSNKSGIFRDTATQGDGFDLIIGEMVKRIPAYFGLYLDGSRDAARVRTLTFAENSICESIGVCAFGYSDTLSGALSLPDSIRDIGAYAFYSCEGINELEIGKGLKNIGSCAFDSCSGIRHMYYNAVSLESGNAMEWRSEKLDLVIGADVEVVPSIWYTWDTNCISSVSFEEGSSCTEISGRTFSRSKIQEIKIPEGVKVIGTWAFSNCANLKEIILPESVESVGVSAFENCTALERVSMGDNVVELGSSAFKNCSALQTVDLSASVDGIDEYTFYKCVSLIGIDIPDTATAIGQYAFEGCTALKSVTMGESVAEIGLRAFYNCTAVEELNYNAASAADLTEESLVFYKFGAESGGASLTIGEKVKRIPAYLFYQGWQTNAAFTTLSFAEGSVCSEIGAYAFFNGAGMPEVILPDSVEIIGESAFASCGDVETLSIGTGTREIGENAFTCYSLSAIYLNAEDLQDGAVAAFTSSRSGRTLELVVGSGVTTIPSHLFNGSAVSVLTFEENSTCTNIGDYAFNNTELRRVRIPDCVVTVGKYAFGNNERMCELTIGSGVTSIGERAFSGGIVLDSISFNAADMADLTDNLYIFENAGTESDTLIVTVGSGVKNIPAYLFRRCTGITDLEMTEGLERVGAYAFFECTGIGSLTIPDSVTAVGAEAFGGCTSVTELTIGKGLVTAGSGAFAGFSRLKSLYFNATAMEDLGAATGMFTDYRRMSGKFDVYVGANVTRIPANLFYYYDHVFGNYHTGSANVKSLVFAEDCVCAEIGYNAFKGCGTLERIEMNSASVDSLVSDGVYAGVFADVGENGLTVVLGEKITVIPNSLFAHCVNLTELDLPDGLRSIGAEAFYCCTGLTEIELPASLISIGEEAFYKCSSLTEITIPDSVTTIESGAFNGCSSVTDLTIGRGVTTVGSAVFGSCSDLEKVYFNAVAMKDVTKTYGIFNSAGTFDLYVGANVTRIPAYLFYYHDNPTGNYRTYSAKVRSLIFAEDCVCAEIGYNAFAGCGTLERIEMNSAAVDNLVSDGTYAGVFADAGENGLTVVLGEKITAIPDALFYNCVNLTQLDLPAGLTAIGAEAFCGCTGLTKLNLPTGLTSIGAEAFYRCSSLTEITIPESVTTIGAWAFRDCGIKTVNFNATAMEDLQEGNWAFYGIADNIEVTVGANVTRIPAYLFAKTTLSRLEFVNGSVCAEIGEYAFQNTKLVEVTIPESMVSIEDGAFYYCTGMEKLIFNAVAAEDCGSCRPFEGCGTQSGGFTAIFGEGVTRIPGGLFENCKTLIEVTIPESVTVIGDNAFNYSIGLEKIHYNAVAVNDFAERNSVFDRAGDSENGIAVTVGPKVTRIPAYLFSAKNWYGNEWTSANVTSLVFVEDSVCESIGAYAFRATKLTDLTIPESVTVLESGAFYDCNQLENIRFEAAELEALNSSSDVFGNCGSADVGLKVTFGENVKKIPDYLFDSCNGLTEVDFGSVGEIGAYAFQNCENLQKVELPNAVTAIGTNAFYICIGLKEVTIPESLTTLGSQAFRGCKQLEKISYNAAALADLPDKNFVFYDAGTSGSGIAVTVGSNVTRIPAYLFCSKNTYGGDYSSTNVTSLAFAENGICESIGTYAFHGTNLTELTIPESVNDLGAYAFYECKKLGEIRFNAASVGDLSSSSRVFSRCGTESSEGLKVTFGPSITRVPRYLFYNCSGLTSIDLGNVTEIAACAFESCIALKEVTIPENLTVLGGYAFNGCRMLEKVNFNAAALGDLNQKNYVFYNAGADTEGIAVTIGPEVTRIPAYLFCTYNGSSYLSTKVGSLTFAENGVCESVGICAFRGSKLTELTIPESVTNLEKQAFYQCGNLVSIQIDAPDLSVASDVFEKCGSADVGLKVSFGSSVKKVPDYLFDGCTGLTEIDFGSVSEIGVYAFGGCTSLKELTIPENIEVIGNSAFYGCRGLEKINFNATALGDLPQKNYVFEYAGMDGSGIAVTVGANVTHIPAYLFSTYDGSYRCPNNVSSLAFEEGSACQSIGASAFRGTNLTSLTIPEGVTTLGTQAFYGCTLLENIFCNAAEIEGLTSKSQVFSDCGSESDRLKVTFGESVASVPEYLFYNCTGLTDIDFGAISEIGACAFYGCTELESVELSDEVTAIGVSAFNNCDGLKELTIPENVEVIGNRAFAYCDALEKVNFNATAMNDLAQGNCAFYNAGTGDEGISVMVAANVTRIPAYLFCAYDGSYYRSTNVSSLVFEEGSECRSIGAYAFRGTNLKEITIPEKVTALGAYAFNSCPALEKINFRAVSMDDIATGGYVFNESGAENGIAVVVGSDVTRIPAYLFCGKNYNNAYASANVSSLQFEEGSVCTGVGDYAFRGTGITEALLPEGIEEIGTGAFYGCSALQKVTIPESVESLGNSAFSGCIGLEKLVLNATLSDFTGSSYVFNNAGADSEGIAVTVGAGVNRIPAYLFRSNSSSANVTSLIFEEGSVCESIGEYAFRGTGIVKLVLPESITAIGDFAFAGCVNLAEVTIPKNMTEVGYHLFNGCTSLEIIHFNTTAMSDLSTSPFLNVGGEKGITMIVGANVTRIPNNLFSAYSSFSYGETNLTSLIFEEGSVCKSIGYRAFPGSRLVKVDLPDSIETIGGYAFYQCYDLTEINIPVSTTKIGIDAFGLCSALEVVHFDAAAMEDLGEKGDIFSNGGKNVGMDIFVGNQVTRIPAHLFHETTHYSHCPKINSVVFAEDSVCESIGTYAFCNTGIECITIPESVKMIGDTAFLGCDMTLVTIESPDIAAAITQEGSCGLLALSRTTLSIPADITQIGTYVTEGYGMQEAITLDGKGYILYSKHTHDWQYSSTIAEPIACEKDGLDRYTCSCDAQKDVVVSCHVLTENEAKAPTCTAVGWDAYETCENCSYTTYWEIPATGHSHKAKVTEPTCTEQGYTTYTCHCGDSYMADYVDALGHDWGEWTETLAPDCTTEGEERRDCGRCDHFETNVLDATGHSHKAKVTEPTCTEQGYTTYTCHCGDSYVADYVDAAGHSFEAWRWTRQPHCETEGKKRRDCENCDAYETKTYDALGHEWGEWTALSETQHKRVCGRDELHIECGDHEWFDGICDVCHHSGIDAEKGDGILKLRLPGFAAGTRILLATYNSEGRMLGVTSQLATQEEYYSIAFNSAAAKIKVMLLAPEWTPLRGSLNG